MPSIFTFATVDLLKTYYKRWTGGAFAKFAYLLPGKSLDLAQFLLIPERALVGGITPGDPGVKVMKSILFLVIVSVLCVTGRAVTDSVLRGIRIVETQDQLHPPRGKLGERGPYQFRRGTWRMHTASSFELAENREVANTVAKRHYAWIKAQLSANGLEPSPYNVALAWNAGVNAVIRGRAPAVSRDYANRVINLVASLVEPAVLREEMPKPVWQAPILVLDETPEQPNLTPEPDAISAPGPVEPAVVVAATSASGQNNPVEVRYYADPILLALNRTVPPNPVNDAPSLLPGFDSASLFAADIPITIGRL